LNHRRSGEGRNPVFGWNEKLDSGLRRDDEEENVVM
jgi:hypothetical protein